MLPWMINMERNAERMITLYKVIPKVLLIYYDHGLLLFNFITYSQLTEKVLGLI